jgi:hypothetical protein
MSMFSLVIGSAPGRDPTHDDGTVGIGGVYKLLTSASYRAVVSGIGGVPLFAAGGRDGVGFMPILPYTVASRWHVVRHALGGCAPHP